MRTYRGMYSPTFARQTLWIARNKTKHVRRYLLASRARIVRRAI